MNISIKCWLSIADNNFSLFGVFLTSPTGDMVQSYVDPSTNVNYFNPAFRPNTEVDARYVQFVSATTANKLAPAVIGQAPSHEVRIYWC